MNIERTYFHNGVEYIKSIMYKHMVNNGEINSGHGKWEGWLHVVHIQRKLTITINGIFFFFQNVDTNFVFHPFNGSVNAYFASILAFIDNDKF